MSKPRKCRWCDATAAYLCDEPTALGGTCDAPICGAHVHRVKFIGHIDYRDKAGRRRGEALTDDRCPDHVPPTDGAKP
ncbi:MAG: hypothetical protein KF873_02120 [Gemmataceae bacterium]|nr:hypothetical protein [Gemmataceae bacterium]